MGIFDEIIDWGKILIDNSIVLANIGSIELGLLVGMWLRGRFIDNVKLTGQVALDFVMFTIVSIYVSLVSTFSNWPVPTWGYFCVGVILPPFTVPLYNGLVAAAPNLLKALMPEGIIKWVLEHTQPPDQPPGKTDTSVTTETNAAIADRANGKTGD
jgi:hypothetical protein